MPAPHEPVVPASARLLIVVAALDVLGAPLDEERVHRLDRVREAAGAAAGEVVQEAMVVRALRAPEGYPGRVPAGGAGTVFLNKAEGEARWAAASRMAVALRPPYAFVVAGSGRAGTGERWP
jgi:probable selenium-dependent hydroxylase accessory protein YqeC